MNGPDLSAEVERAARQTGDDKPAQKLADLMRLQLGVRVSGSRLHAFLVANEHDLKVWAHAVWHRAERTRQTHQHGERRTP